MATQQATNPTEGPDLDLIRACREGAKEIVRMGAEGHDLYDGAMEELWAQLAAADGIETPKFSN